MSIEISAEARRFARGTGLDGDEGFVLAIATALSDLGANARRAEVIETASAQRIRELTAERDAADTEGRKAGAVAERQRIRAILEASEAEGREEVARSLAFNSELPADAAITALASAPKASPLAGWGAAAPTEPKPLTPEVEAALQARAAGQGVQTVDGNYVSVANDPAPPRKAADPVKSMWKETIAGINRESSGTNAAK